FDALARLLERDADLATFGAVHQLPELARHVCLRRELPLAPMQKLTVMAQRLPQLFQRTLGGTLLVARTLGWSGAALDDLFAAALFGDIGLLHLASVSDDAVTVPQYSPETLHHGATSAAILEFESGFSATVIAAVADHHERP